jgi:hypothetical protein
MNPFDQIPLPNKVADRALSVLDPVTKLSCGQILFIKHLSKPPAGFWENALKLS